MPRQPDTAAHLPAKIPETNDAAAWPAPTSDNGRIRRVTRAELGAMARILAQAFYDDPLMRWMVPNDALRLQRLERVFGISSHRVWLPQNESYVSDELVGACAWMPPNTWHLGLLAQMRMLPGFARALRGDLSRMLKLDTFLENKHPHEPAHWYLNAMGVVPAWQGRGCGTAMLQPVLARCDAEGVPAYLETSTQRGRVLYERNGFEVVEQCRFADDGPPLWLMWREPQSERRESVRVTPTERA